jgi:6,7-dimethyl-8-ribityllumazine synthase
MILKKNLSDFNASEIPSGIPYRVGIAVAEWNHDITGNLLSGAMETLLTAGVLEENIQVVKTPGAFELPLACQWLLKNGKVDGTIAIGCVIQGETKHFDFVCQGVTQGIMKVGLKFDKPVVFCVLTDQTLQQSQDRSGGKHGNKGVETAIALIKMLYLRKQLG